MTNCRSSIAFLLLPLALLLFGSRFLPAHQTPSLATSRSTGRGYLQVLGHRPALGLLGSMLIFAIAYVGWLTSFGAHAERDFGATANTLSALFFVAGIAELGANLLTPALLQRIAPRRVFAVATVIMAADLLASDVLFTRLWTLSVSIVAISICAAALYIAGNALLLDAIPPARGTVMALGSASIGAGAARGSLLGGGALALFDDYVFAYRLLGLLLSLAIIAIVLSAHDCVRPESAWQTVRA